MSPIEDLAQRQLTAYNTANLDAFVACYHEDIVVLNDDEESLRGRDAFRERYAGLFNEWEYGADVPQRLGLGDHCVDFETWWRIDPSTGERSEGSVLVRYSLRDGLIGVVQFLG